MTFGLRADKASGMAKMLLVVRLRWTPLPLLPKAKWRAGELTSPYLKSEKLKMVPNVLPSSYKVARKIIEG